MASYPQFEGASQVISAISVSLEPPEYSSKGSYLPASLTKYVHCSHGSNTLQNATGMTWQSGWRYSVLGERVRVTWRFLAVAQTECATHQRRLGTSCVFIPRALQSQAATASAAT